MAWKTAHPIEWWHCPEEEDGSLPLTWPSTGRKDFHSWILSFFLILTLFHKEVRTILPHQNLPVPMCSRLVQSDVICWSAKVFLSIKEQEVECQWLLHTLCNGIVKSLIVLKCVSAAVTWALAFFGHYLCCIRDRSYICVHHPSSLHVLTVLSPRNVFHLILNSMTRTLEMHFG